MRRCLKKIFLFLFFAHLGYVGLIAFINPPITIFQIEGMVYSLQHREVSFSRDYVGWKDISYSAKLAAIAAEDQKFLEHNGFDWESLKKSLNSKRKGKAASTISQQVAKNVFLWQGSGWSKYLRKPFEFYFTFLIETFYPKKRILELYLNISEMGPGIYGIEAASQHYFRKPASKLSREEAAAILACMPNPKRFSPRNVGYKKRWILRQMRQLETPELRDFLE